VKPLKKVTKVKAVRYSTTAVKVSWKQTKQAEYYKAPNAGRNEESAALN
jgi:hypothetical protein